MKHLTFVFYLLIVFAFTACKQSQNDQTYTEVVPRSYLENYQAPSFSTDDQIEKVKGAASQFEEIFVNNAEERNIPGIAYGVVVGDSLVLAGASGVLELESKRPSSAQAAFRIASMTKSFTAMAIIQLRDAGKLSLEDPVSKYIPEVGLMDKLTADAPDIDIENLLTMTAGFPEDNPWGDRQLEEPDEMLIDLIGQGLTFSTTTSMQYEYSNTGYAMLGHIVSEVSGMPYQDYIRQNIFQPLGMNNTYWEYENVPEELFAIGYRWEDEQWKTEPILHDGAFGAMGGLITTIEDFSKYVSFHLSAWPPRNGADKGPISRASLREMQTPQFPRLSTRSTDYNGENCPRVTGYGFGLSIVTDCHRVRAVSHGGALPGYGSNYVFYPEYGVGVMAFGNLTYTGPLPRNPIEKLLFDDLKLEPRELPVSDILSQRSKEVFEMIKNWDPELEKKILAENFYLDQSREDRMEQIQEILEKAGAVSDIQPVRAFNQLRAHFQAEGSQEILNVYFTLTPEKDPKVQYLDVWIDN